MNKIRVLFVSAHNSSRSQIAEAFLNRLAGDEFEAFSAGITPRELSPFAVQVMRRIGFDISNNKTKNVLDFSNSNAHFDYVVLTCDKQTLQICPVFLNTKETIHWDIIDPEANKRDNLQILESTKKVRDIIKSKVISFLKETTQKKKENFQKTA
ncbi:MAG: arsenate reductase ArsC [Elusimicrobia bacterium]|nr:arsenate reductase ArsC [Candidatus Liberimonas magnetica]